MRISCGCGYEEQVYDGPGMLVVREACVCLACQAVVGVIVAAPGAGRTERESPLNRCPTCGGTDLAPWKEPFSCPRCGRPAQTHVVGLWD